MNEFMDGLKDGVVSEVFSVLKLLCTMFQPVVCHLSSM